MKIVLQSIVVVLVSAVTWFLCSPLRARPVPTLDSITTHTKQKAGAAAANANAALDYGKSGASLDVAMVRGSAGIVDGRVVAFAQAQIFDREPNHSYLWVFRMLDADNHVVQKVVYDQQIFSVNRAEVAKPTFEDAFPVGDLLPGDYLLQVSLHRSPNGQDLTAVADDSPSNSYRMAGTNFKVSVP